ncbi:MAG: ribonuclease E/G, partial [Rhodospirillales bacterium]|nr:ribonuclease E/G [Rhodospirillales bacterium]
LDAIHSPEVQMKSGAYIVINPTEALVSIDVNSGRSTRERNIEETAFKTNLEAADEIARQLRLRDLAGLIVIDFIDMEVSRNNSQVEKRMKDAMRNDRARIQIGRISPFGLLELSRQRLRMSLIETSSEPCPYCGGTGIRRSTDSASLVALRAIQEEANRQRASELIVHVPTAVALYILNQKRPALASIEQSTSISVVVTADESLIPPDLRIERVEASGRVETVNPLASTPVGESQGEEKPGKRRRRPRRPKRNDDEAVVQENPEDQVEKTSDVKGDSVQSSEVKPSDDDGEDDKAPKRRRRGKRGGRRRRGRTDEQVGVEAGEGEAPAVSVGESEASTDAPAENASEAIAEQPEEEKAVKKPVRRRSRAKKADEADVTVEAPVEIVVSEEAVEAKEEKPKRVRRPRKKVTEAKDQDNQPAEPEVDPQIIAEAAKTTVINVGDGEPAEKEEKKKGWWRR